MQSKNSWQYLHNSSFGPTNFWFPCPPDWGCKWTYNANICDKKQHLELNRFELSDWYFYPIWIKVVISANKEQKNGRNFIVCTLEIKPFGLGPRIRDMEAKSYKLSHFLVSV